MTAIAPTRQRNLKRRQRPNPQKAVGKKLRLARLERGYSPENFGALVGLSGRTIRRIEAGEVFPNPRTMYRIAEELELKVTDLWRL